MTPWQIDITNISNIPPKEERTASIFGTRSLLFGGNHERMREHGRETRANVLECVVRFGECTSLQIAEELEMVRDTVNHHLAALRKDGVIVKEMRGYQTFYRMKKRIGEELCLK